MNSFVVYDALIVGLKEGFKLGCVALVFYSYLNSVERRHLMVSFCAGLFVSGFISVAAIISPVGAGIREWPEKVIESSFAIFLMAGFVALFHASGSGILRPLQDISSAVRIVGLKGREKASTFFLSILVFLATVLFFFPEGIGSGLFLKELGVMKESIFLTYVSALCGGLIGLVPLLVIALYMRPFRMIGGFFDFPQLLLFIAVVKLLGGGIKGIAEITLIPSIQRGVMKFAHDFIHHSFVLIMVPDHPLLKTTVWNFIGFFFGPNLAIIASLALLLFLPGMFLYYRLFKKMPEPDAETGAERRMIKYGLLSNRRRKSVPVLLFVSLIVVAWFAGRGESVSRLYVPKPKPVVEDKGVVLIPVNDPTMDLRDGSIHKFSLSHEGKEMRIMVVKRANNTFAVCLDACEICPPVGYGQRDDLVVCIYCNTPIPVATLGKAGGCNPIPLSSSIDDRFIRIEMGEILKKWEYVKAKAQGTTK